MNSDRHLIALSTAGILALADVHWGWISSINGAFAGAIYGLVALTIHDCLAAPRGPRS